MVAECYRDRLTRFLETLKEEHDAAANVLDVSEERKRNIRVNRKAA
jgi:hypothetical protein